MTSDDNGMEEQANQYSAGAIRDTVTSLARLMGIRRNHSQLPTEARDLDRMQNVGDFVQAAHEAGISLRKTAFRSASECVALVAQGYPVILGNSRQELLVLESVEGSKLEATIVSDGISRETIQPSQISSFADDGDVIDMFVAEPEMPCAPLSGATDADSDGHHHPEPLQRMIALFNLDARDIGWVVLFAFVSGILGLATPLVVEGLVNVVSWGTYFQPLLVLAAMLLICLGIASFLKVLQTCVVEIIQRRQFVRIVSDLSHRFPRAKQTAIEKEFPRELANRVFDIMTIQKATAILLLDGLSIVLTTILGMVLLAFYHPFLLGFDIVLVLSMIFITWILGRGGIRTAIEESKTKYAVAYWLQDVLSFPAVFKTGGAEQLAIRRADELTAQYIAARRRQFMVVIRQVIFAVSLQAIASTVLLGLGGWLVIHSQLTLGQLVASELVVTVVVGAFAKAGKSLEKFYDMMAAMDKVGHLLDIPAEPRATIGRLPEGPFGIGWSDLTFQSPSGTLHLPARKISPGARVAITGNDHESRSRLARSLVGLMDPSGGHVSVAGMDSCELSTEASGRWVGYAAGPDIFHGSLVENIDLGRQGVDRNAVREAANIVGLESKVWSLSDGWNTQLISNGYPLSDDQQHRLVIARAIAGNPNLLVIDRTLDRIDEFDRGEILERLIKNSDRWTLVIVTSCKDIASRCDEQIVLSKPDVEAQ